MTEEHGIEVTQESVVDNCHRNLTREWFEENWEYAYDLAKKALTRKFRKSHNSDAIDDFVMDFITKYISNDGFRPVILNKTGPTKSSIRSFAIRTTIDSLRVRGQDYYCRTTYGSRTSNEYIKDVVIPDGGVFEDRYKDDIETRIYLMQKLEMIMKRITENVDQIRHQDLREILVHIANEVTCVELEDVYDYDRTDIRRVKRFLKPDE